MTRRQPLNDDDRGTMVSIARRAQTTQAPPDAEAVEPALMTVPEAAAVLGWSEKQVRTALERGVLAGFKPGGLHSSRWAVYRWSVDELADGRRGVDTDALAVKFRKHFRLTAELTALSHEIEEDLRNATIFRDGGDR